MNKQKNKWTWDNFRYDTKYKTKNFFYRKIFINVNLSFFVVVVVVFLFVAAANFILSVVIVVVMLLLLLLLYCLQLFKLVYTHAHLPVCTNARTHSYTFTNNLNCPQSVTVIIYKLFPFLCSKSQLHSGTKINKYIFIVCICVEVLLRGLS